MSSSLEGAIESQQFAMTVDLNVLDRLGFNLYSNTAAVITKVVANARDADPCVVNITFDPNGDLIEINDDESVYRSPMRTTWNRPASLTDLRRSSTGFELERPPGGAEPIRTDAALA